MTPLDLFQAILAPAHGHSYLPGGITYAVETLADGRKWLILQGTVELQDYMRDARFFGRLIAAESGDNIIAHDGMAEAAQFLAYIGRECDAITGHSLGAGQGQLVGILTGRPAVIFGGPRIVYKTPKGYQAPRCLNLIPWGDPIAHVVPGMRWKCDTLRFGPPQFCPRGEFHRPAYYLKHLKESAVGWLDIDI